MLRGGSTSVNAADSAKRRTTYVRNWWRYGPNFAETYKRQRGRPGGTSEHPGGRSLGAAIPYGNEKTEDECQPDYRDDERREIKESHQKTVSEQHQQRRRKRGTEDMGQEREGGNHGCLKGRSGNNSRRAPRCRKEDDIRLRIRTKYTAGHLAWLWRCLKS